MDVERSVIHIDVPIAPQYRAMISEDLESCASAVELTYSDRRVVQHFLGTGTEVALAALVVAVARLLIAIRAEIRATEWDLERVKAMVQTRAAEVTGTDELSDIHFDGLEMFLKKETDSCRVTAMIHDELYWFLVLRRGSVIALRQQ